MDILNKPLKEFKSSYIRQNIKAVSFDVDGVIIPTGTFLRENMAGTKLVIKTHKLSPRMVKMVKQLKKYVWINFSSGRALLYLQDMLGDILWDRVSLTAENGNFILMNGQVQQLFIPDENYFQKITNIREDLKKLKIKHLNNVFGFEPKHMIITVYTSKKMPEVEKIVRKHDKEEEFYCLWTNEGYDIGHKDTNKVNALHFLTKKLKIKLNQIITTGNNLNDKEMLKYGIGVTIDPERVSGKYAIPKKQGVLGGEILAAYLLKAYNDSDNIKVDD